MEQQLYELPEGWEWSDLNSACSIITDGAHASPKTKPDGKPYVTVRDVNDAGVIDLHGCKKISDEDFQRLVESNCGPKEGAVLFSKDGTVGKVALVKDYQPFVVLSSLAILEPKFNLLMPEYLRWFLLSPTLQESALGKKTGAAIKRIVLRTIKTLEIPLPPINEQKRIVAKLDALFTRIDTAITHLLQTHELSKALFASALDEAFNPNGEKETLPRGWASVRVEDVCNKITDGAHKTPKYVSEGIPFLSVKNISKGVVDFSNTRFITKETHNELYKRCNPEFGDLLYTKVGTTGIAKVNDTEKEFSLFVSVALLKPKSDVIKSHFFEYMLNSPDAYAQAQSRTRGVANRNLVLRDIKNIEIPLPPLNEQDSIVAHLDALAERTRDLEAATKEKLSDLTALKASLLDAAFKGQL